MVSLDDLSVPQVFALACIVRGGPDPAKPMACVELEWLESQGCTNETVEQLIDLDLVTLWDHDRLCRLMPPRVTLDPYAAHLLGVHILERTTIKGDELVEDPYWAELTQEPRSIHLPKRRHEIRWPWMDELPDPDSVKRAGEVLCDDEGEPVTVLGMPVPVDKRLKGVKQSERKAG